MPVYKESLTTVLAPSIESIKTAMRTYARQGGTSTIFVNDDGMQLLAPELQEERMRFYDNRNIGWVARPPHGADGFVRAGRFKACYAAFPLEGMLTFTPTESEQHELRPGARLAHGGAAGGAGQG